MVSYNAFKNIILDDQFFSIDHLKENIKSISVRGGAVTMAAQAALFLLKMGSTMVLARILTPNDYGIFGMVMAVAGFLTMFKDMGLSMATVQQDEITHKQISTLFWVNVCFSIILMLIVMAIAPVIAWFYKEPRLTLVTLALAGGFIFSGLTIQHQALLKRQMRFFALAVIEVSSFLIGILVAILAACFGCRYWALVFQQLFMLVALCVGAWIMCGWRPGLPFKRSGIRSMLAFGANLSGFNIFNYFIRNLDKVLIGRYWGAWELGLYNKSYQLLLLPIQHVITPISKVVVSGLSRLQNDPSRYRQYYCTILNMVAFWVIPITVFSAALSREIILILLGNQWLEASMIFKVLALACIGQPLTGTAGWIFVSMGRTKIMMVWALISLPIYSLSFIIGVQKGTLSVAIAYAISDYLMRILMLYMAFNKSPINISDFLGAIWRPFIISIFLYPLLSMTRAFLGASNSFYIFFCSFIIGIIFFVMAILAWPKARLEASNFLKIISKLQGEKKSLNN